MAISALNSAYLIDSLVLWYVFLKIFIWSILHVGMLILEPPDKFCLIILTLIDFMFYMMIPGTELNYLWLIILIDLFFI